MVRRERVAIGPKLAQGRGVAHLSPGEGRLADAIEVLDSLVLTDDPPEFLPHPAYSRLD